MSEVVEAPVRNRKYKSITLTKEAVVNPTPLSVIQASEDRIAELKREYLLDVQNRLGDSFSNSELEEHGRALSDVSDIVLRASGNKMETK